MKKALLYLLLYTYTASIFKPVMPYISDSIAHTFYYAEHVKTVHTENGKSHVHYELMKHNKASDKDSEDTMKKISLANEHLIITALSCNTFNFLLNHTYPLLPGSSKINVELSTDFPPPRC